MNEYQIRTELVPHCPLCGAEDCRVLYSALRDRLFRAPGLWTLKRCCRCGLIFLSPRPIQDDAVKAYVAYCTHAAPVLAPRSSPVRRIYRAVKHGYLSTRWGYNERIAWWQEYLSPLLYVHPGRRTDVDFSVMYLNATVGGRLVDVGCGSGELIERLGALGWETEGVDFDESAIRVARARGLTAHVGTLQSQKYAEASFDAITMSHVIEHVHHPLELLRECHRILKPGGRLVIATPNSESWGHERYGIHWVGLDPPRHLFVLTPSLLRCLLELAGFQNPEVWTTCRVADTLFIASQSIRRTGSYEMESFQPLAIRIQGKTMHLAEWVLLKANPSKGQEIIAVAGKQYGANA